MNEIPNMIQNGGFGSYEPMNTYNPYTSPPQYCYGNNMQYQPNNMIQFGGGYQTPYQQQGFVFQPVPQYQQPQQRQDNYYDPYGTMANTSYSPYGLDYNYNSGYNGYINGYGYTPQYQHYQQTVTAMENAQKNQLLLNITFHKAVNKMMGVEMTDDELERIYNPNHPANQPPKEEVERLQEFNRMKQLYQFEQNYQYQPTTSQMIANAKMQKYAQELNEIESRGYNVYEYLKFGLSELMWNQWVRDNCLSSRNMRGTYDSDQYNQLLRMHMSTSPMVNQLLDESMYDNNTDDYEVGMNAAMERERRRQQILKGGVPDFISSPETQKQRAEWTKQLMNQIYSKEAMKNNV